MTAVTEPPRRQKLLQQLASRSTDDRNKLVGEPGASYGSFAARTRAHACTGGHERSQWADMVGLRAYHITTSRSGRWLLASRRG